MLILSRTSLLLTSIRLTGHELLLDLPYPTWSEHLGTHMPGGPAVPRWNLDLKIRLATAPAETSALWLIQLLEQVHVILFVAGIPMLMGADFTRDTRTNV